MKIKNQENVIYNNTLFFENTVSCIEFMSQSSLLHGPVCTVANKNTQWHNASGDAVDTSLLDYIETSETKNESTFSYNYKIVESGRIIEIYKYDDEKYKIIKADKEDLDKKTKTNIKKEKKKSETDQEYIRSEETINETRRRLKRLINANIGQYNTKDKFITLTFKDFLTRDEVVHAFKLFNKRLRYKYPKCNYQYIAVIEKGTQNTERLHLHCLFFGLPYIKVDVFQEIWEYGIVNMKALKDYKDVSSYMLKYVSKTLKDGSFIPKGKKFYIPSLNLKKPTQKLLKNKDAIKYISFHLPSSEILYEHNFNSPFVGKFHYLKIKLQGSNE